MNVYIAIGVFVQSVSMIVHPNKYNIFVYIYYSYIVEIPNFYGINFSLLKYGQIRRAFDVIREIAARTDTEAFLYLCQTNKRFKMVVCGTEFAWVKRIKQDTGVDVDKLKPDYIKRYKDLYKLEFKIVELLKEFKESKDKKIKMPTGVKKYMLRFKDELEKSDWEDTYPEKSIIAANINILLDQYLKMAIEENNFNVFAIGPTEIGDNETVERFFAVMIMVESELYPILIESEQIILKIVRQPPLSILALATYVARQNKTKGRFYRLLMKIYETLKLEEDE